MDEERLEALLRYAEGLEKRIEVLEMRRADPGGVTGGLHEKYPRGMTKAEAAVELGVTRQTVYAMIADGRLRESVLGRVITQSVVDALYGNVKKKSRLPRGNRWNRIAKAGAERA